MDRGGRELTGLLYKVVHAFLDVSLLTYGIPLDGAQLRRHVHRVYSQLKRVLYERVHECGLLHGLLQQALP